MQPYYEHAGIQIYHGDCREILPELPQVDLVLTSPPFNIGNIHHCGAAKHSPYPDQMPENEYQSWQIDILDRINAKAVLYQHKNRLIQGEEISPRSWIQKTKWKIKQSLVWINGGPNHDPIRFFPKTERVYWLSEGESVGFDNRTQWDVFDCTPDNKPLNGTSHTRTFPLELARSLLRPFAFGTVLDPFAGSGTTLRAAKDLGRKAIGIEISERYCEIAANRLRQEVFEFA